MGKPTRAAGLAQSAFVLGVGDAALFQRGFEHVANGQAGGKLRLLLHVGDAGALANRDVTCIGIFFSCKDFQQGTLACAVRPDQADAVAVGDGEGDIAKESSGAKGLGQRLRI